jgi:uncharacterized membrane protein
MNQIIKRGAKMDWLDWVLWGGYAFVAIVVAWVFTYFTTNYVSVDAVEVMLMSMLGLIVGSVWPVSVPFMFFVVSLVAVHSRAKRERTARPSRNEFGEAIRAFGEAGAAREAQAKPRQGRGEFGGDA